METAQGNALQALRGVQAFIVAHAESFPAVADSGARRKLDRTITELANLVAMQAGSDLAARGATQVQRRLRRLLLRRHMVPIARIARAGLLHQLPELEPLRMPAGRPTAELLAAHAYGMAEAAEPHAAVFIGAGLSDAFISELRRAAEALIGSLKDRVQCRAGRGAATKGLRTKLSAARRLVHVLDSLAQDALADDPALLAGWDSVKRVRRIASRRSVATFAAAVPEGNALPRRSAIAALADPSPRRLPVLPHALIRLVTLYLPSFLRGRGSHAESADRDGWHESKPTRPLKLLAGEVPAEEPPSSMPAAEAPRSSDATND
jgi:hypothetical protein